MGYFRTAIKFFIEKFYLLGRLKEEPMLTADGNTGQYTSNSEDCLYKIKTKTQFLRNSEEQVRKMAKKFIRQGIAQRLQNIPFISATRALEYPEIQAIIRNITSVLLQSIK